MWPFKKPKNETSEQKNQEENVPEGPECAACGEPGADKKWGGQWWHKKCLRKLKKKAKGMM
jgi:hypothetical protein